MTDRVSPWQHEPIMLDADTPALAPAGDTTPASQREEVVLCRTCGVLVSTGRWRISVNGAHEHVVFNPAGRLFRVWCFSEAPGAVAYGPASLDFTWFRGHPWQIALCQGCRSHLGWCFTTAGVPAFYGLSAAALVVREGGTAS